MNLLNSLTVRGKLTLAFGSILSLMFLLGGLAVWQLSRVQAQADSVLSLRLPGVRDSQRMLATATLWRQREFRAIISTPQEMPDSIARIEKAKSEFESARKDYAFSDTDTTEKR